MWVDTAEAGGVTPHRRILTDGGGDFGGSDSEGGRLGCRQTAQHLWATEMRSSKLDCATS